MPIAEHKTCVRIKTEYHKFGLDKKGEKVWNKYRGDGKRQKSELCLYAHKCLFKRNRNYYVLCISQTLIHSWNKSKNLNFNSFLDTLNGVKDRSPALPFVVSEKCFMAQYLLVQDTSGLCHKSSTSVDLSHYQSGKIEAARPQLGHHSSLQSRRLCDLDANVVLKWKIAK